MRESIRIAAALALLVPAAAAAQDQQPKQGPVAPEVTVQQPAPDVRVEQQAPDVQIRQARPDVQIDLAKPEVDIQAAQPQVNVLPAQAQIVPEIQRATPDVNIQQAKPIVNIEQAEPQVQVEAPQGEPKITVQKVSRRDQQILGSTGGQDIVGMEAVDPEDEEVGKVRDVLMAADGSVDSIVVEAGGGLLSGDKLVAVPLDQAEIDRENKKVRLKMSESRVKDLQEFSYEADARQALRGPEKK